jgi:hypothetical protein
MDVGKEGQVVHDDGVTGSVQRQLSEWSRSPGIGIFPAILKLTLSLLEITILTVAVLVLWGFHSFLSVCCCVSCVASQTMKEHQQRLQRPCERHEGREGCCDRCNVYTASIGSSIWAKHLLRIWFVAWSHVVFSVLAIASCSFLLFFHPNLCEFGRDQDPLDQDPLCCFHCRHCCSCCSCSNSCSCCPTTQVQQAATPAPPPAARSFPTIELSPIDPRHPVHPFVGQPMVVINIVQESSTDLNPA